MQVLPTKISANGTVTPLPFPAFLSMIMVSVTSAGSAWTLQITDTSGNAIYVANPVAVGNFYQLLPGVTYMSGQVNIVTSGTTAGVAYVWLGWGKTEGAAHP